MLWGISFHMYGLIVGIAVAVVWQLVEKLNRKWEVPPRLAQNWVWVVVAALVGARAWHLWTDWSWYQPLVAAGEWWRLIAVWQGGLSVLGALVTTLLVIRWLGGNKWLIGADVLVLAMPWGQVIGRWANWWNQELYGLPTTLPWGIEIDLAHRLPSVVQFSHFHPLFAYEALGVLILAIWLWRQQKIVGWQPGHGKLTLAYLAGYSWWRFSLDFLRVDRPVIWGGLSQNQWCLVLVGSVCVGWLVKGYVDSQKKNISHITASQKLWLIISVILLVVGIVSGIGWLKQKIWTTGQFHQVIETTADGGDVQLFVRRPGAMGGQARSLTPQPLRLRLAKTPQSRTVGLSGLSTIPGDGMLFWFEQSGKWLFWMHDTHVNLDFVWISQGQVIGTTEKVAAPDLSTQETVPVLEPPSSVDTVLELPAGVVEKLGIQLGDVVQLYPK